MDTLEELKEDIARKADKEKYEAGKLKAKDDLNAVPEVFLSVTGGKGKHSGSHWIHSKKTLYR